MSDGSKHALLYGLRVDSQVPLHHRRWVPADVPADVTIRVGDTLAANDREPIGRRLLDLPIRARRTYAAAASEDGGYILRCYDTCDFRVDAGLREVTVHPVRGADGVVPVLTAGMLPSFILTLRGETVLHASAVQVGERALAFVGSSGMGKSTVAAIMCADGAPLVTDDVLRLDLDASRRQPPSCHVGTTELRIRKSAGALLSLFEESVSVRRTADARSALQVRAATRPELPLGAIVVPVPDHDESRRSPTVEQLDTKQALLTLLRFPRLLGWQDHGIVARQFHELGQLVERVPVYTARLPWGPPFPPGTAADLRDAVGLTAQARDRS